MRKITIAASIAALALATQAQAASVCKQDSTGRTVATVAGAGIGAILGRVIDGGRHKEVGTIGGAVAGGIAGNQLAKGSDKCDVSYGYYDESGRWHANRIAASDARGYYDRSNRWVEGAPNGYYDRYNNWVALNGDAAGAGYRDRDGRWVPVGVTGYYAADGEWIQASAPGYYDSRGRWIAGPTSGSYDARGRWVADTGRYTTPTGYWSASTVPGYYNESGRWVAGRTTGYYDARGRFIPTPAGPGAAIPVAYRDRDVVARETRMEARIDRQRANGMISRREADAARAELASIRRDEEKMRRSGGRFTMDEQSVIHQRLDQLGATIRAEREDDDDRAG